MDWTWPLAKSQPEVPRGDHPGAFGAVRKYDRHTGVDLYCERHEGVQAVEDGLVVAILPFTGFNESPWWNDTWAIMIEGRTGVVLYGELAKQSPVGLNDFVKAGEWIGNVERVLKNDKGRPMDMLHLELYKRYTRTPTWWRLDEPNPEGLWDPTNFLDKR